MSTDQVLEEQPARVSPPVKRQERVRMSAWKPARIIVTIPTYNEVENIALLVEQVLLADARIEIVVADDSSPDGTASLVGELARKDRRVHLLHRTREFGRGHAGRDAFAWALAHDADIVIEMDADFSHHPRHIPTLIKALEDADVVMGSRQVRGGKDLGRPAWRVMLTRVSNVYVRWVLGVHIRDCNSGFPGISPLSIGGHRRGPRNISGTSHRSRTALQVEGPKLAVGRNPHRVQGTRAWDFVTFIRQTFAFVRHDPEVEVSRSDGSPFSEIGLRISRQMPGPARINAPVAITS